MIDIIPLQNTSIYANNTTLVESLINLSSAGTLKLTEDQLLRQQLMRVQWELIVSQILFYRVLTVILLVLGLFCVLILPHIQEWLRRKYKMPWTDSQAKLNLVFRLIYRGAVLVLIAWFLLSPIEPKTLMFAQTTATVSLTMFIIILADDVVPILTMISKKITQKGECGKK